MPKAAFVTRKQCRGVLAYLTRSPSENLILIDLVQEISRSWRDPGTQVVAAWDGNRIVGVASLRPSIVTDVAMKKPISPLVASLIMMDIFFFFSFFFLS